MATYKRGFGYHPLLCFLDNIGEALAGVLRAGNAGADTATDHVATDHVTVLDQALAQIPEAHRHGTPILIRADSDGGAKAFLRHIRTLHSRGIVTCFSVGQHLEVRHRAHARVEGPTDLCASVLGAGPEDEAGSKRLRSFQIAANLRPNLRPFGQQLAILRLMVVRERQQQHGDLRS